MVRDLLVGPGEGDWDEVGFESEGDPTDGDTLRVRRRLDALSWFKLGGVIGGWVSRETGRLGGGGWWVAASAPTEEIGAEGVDGRTGGCGADITILVVSFVVIFINLIFFLKTWRSQHFMTYEMGAILIASIDVFFFVI